MGVDFRTLDMSLVLPVDMGVGEVTSIAGCEALLGILHVEVGCLGGSCTWIGNGALHCKLLEMLVQSLPCAWEWRGGQ